ncbi:MAG TPA: type II secretion system protein [Gemmatimonadales bacterium]|nr:type II secretion system protein [Gemmatimonadales bacterium]
MTLIELLIALTVVGALSALALPRAGTVWDRIAVDRAGIELMSFYHTARFGAIQRAVPVRIVFREDSLLARFAGLEDSTFLVRRGPQAHGVQLTGSRDEIGFYANGAAFGAANTKLVLRRGKAVDSITTSRLGRLKRWR